MFDESSPRVHEGSLPVSDAHRVAEIDEGRSHHAILRASRGWKLFLLLPRLLLHRSPREGKIPKAQLQRRMEAFSRGEWASLLASERESSARGVQAFARRQRRPVCDDVESRTARAEQLARRSKVQHWHQGHATLVMLQNPLRRPPTLRDPIPQDILEVEPGSPFVLDPELLARNIRSARRGAAAGPSGMTADHLRVILESAPDTSSFSRAAQDLARAQVPLTC